MNVEFQLIPKEYITEALMNKAPVKEYVPLPLIEDLLLCILEEASIYDIFNFCLAYPQMFDLVTDYIINKKLSEGINQELNYIFTALFKGDFLGKSSKQGCYSSKGFIIYCDLTELNIRGEKELKYETEYAFKIVVKNSELYLYLEKERFGISSEKQLEIPKGYIALNTMVEEMTAKILQKFPEGFEIYWEEYDLKTEN